MKIFSIFLTLLLFAGCASTVCEQQPLEAKVVVKTVEVKVPVACKVPKINCDFSDDGFMPIEKMRQCIIEQKRALEVCAKTK